MPEDTFAGKRFETVKGNVVDTPPAKRQTRNADRTRARILKAATHIFATKGPDAARVDEIAEQAQINKRMLYHYFGNKEGLYLAVLQEVYSRLAEIRMEINEADKLKDILDELIQKYFDFLERNPEFVHLLNWENSHNAVGLKRANIASVASPIIEFVGVVMKREQKNRTIRSDLDLNLFVMTALALCSYYHTNRYSLSVIFGMDLFDPQMKQRWLEHIKRFVYEGIAVRPANESTPSP